MRQGKFARVPERPGDLELLWSEAQRLDPAHLPDWLTVEDVDDYRYVGCITESDLSEEESCELEAELEELELARLIVDPDANLAGVHHIYMAVPRWEDIWSIGIYTGDSPIRLSPAPLARNPVLTRDDVSDVPAVFVADPFMVRVADTWHMFFEVMNWRTRKGEIGWATSADGWKWNYRRIVLTEPFHLSYPYVFQWQDRFYMIPESHQAKSVRLYEAVQFPERWRHVATLLEGPLYADASILRFQERWWLFVDASPEMGHDTLRLFHATELFGPWVEHPMSPIVRQNPQIARPGGRIVEWDGKLVRFAQNCSPRYGTDVRAVEITDLTVTSYREEQIGSKPILGPTGAGWNSHGMHHVDAQKLLGGGWIACVDGWKGLIS